MHRMRVFSSVLTFSFVAAILVALPTASADPDDEVVVPASTQVTNKPDAVSAMLAAQNLGSPVENTEQRTEATRTFANPDGTWSTEIASGPERVQDADGSWTDIDTTLEQNPQGNWVPSAAAAAMTFSGGGADPFVTMRTRSDASFGLSWPEQLPEPVVEGSTLTYRNVVTGGDLVVEALPHGFSHNIVLREAPTDDSVTFELPVELDGLTLVEQPTGAISVRTTGGKEIASAPEPLMWDDETTAAGEPENVTPLQTTVDGSGADATLTLTPDMGVLQDPATEYPVTIDPTFNEVTTGDTWLQNAGFTTAQTGSTEMRAGTYDGGGHKARSFVRFNIDALAGKHILSADLRLRNYFSNSCNLGAIRVNAIEQSWTAANMTWGNQPDVWPGNFYDFHQAYGATGCAANWATWDVTPIVVGWNNGTWANNGLRLKAYDETNNSSWRKYRSANFNDPGVKPRLIVDYNNYPNPAGKPLVAPGSNVGYARTETPTIKSTLRDPDNGKVQGYFEVRGSAGTLIWSGTSTLVASGSTASVTVPAGELNSGWNYTVTAKAQDTDGALSKSESTSTTFKVDTTIPTVTIDATGFTEDTWAPSKPATNTFTLTGSADTSNFEVLKDTESAITVPANASGVGTLDWNVDSGWHTLTVIPHDKAGNAPKTADATTFSFGVRKPAFITPRSEQGSLDVFRLEPVAPSGASSMTIKWRNAGATAWNTADGVTTPAGSPWNGTTSDSGHASTPGALLWDASQQIDPGTGAKVLAPRLLELQACFTYPTETACSNPLEVDLDDGFGATYPTTDLGPAVVALATGALQLDSPDPGTGAVDIGRVWSTSQAAVQTDGPFGRGWQFDVAGEGATETTVIDNRAVDGTFVLSYATGGDETFIKQPGSVGTYLPADATNTVTKLELNTTASPDTLELSEDTNATTPIITKWHLDDALEDAEGNVIDEAEWVLDTMNAPGTAADVTVSSAGRRINWISQVPEGTSATCTATTQAEGCRGLLLNYDDVSGHINSVTEKVHPFGSPNTVSNEVATYEYVAGLLSKACSIDPDGTDGPDTPLCVEYTYDTTRSAPRLVSVTPPGQVPWQYSYDATGRVSGVRRALTDGTGHAAWVVDYDLSVSAAGLPDMSAPAAAAWGQAIIPTKVMAIYEPRHDGQVPTGDPTQARLFYTDAGGSVTNTAVYGFGTWLVDTKWYDQYGNVVQWLDGSGWARVQAALPAERLSVARNASTFTTYSSTGERVEEEYGVATTATLADGTTGLFREHVTYVHDDEAPALGGPRPAGSTGAFDLVVEERYATAQADMSGKDFDETFIRNEYDPVVDGDGNGWELGLPTRIKTPDGSGWSTEIMRYNHDGDIVEAREPGGAANASGEGSDALSTLYAYYTSGPNAIDGDCGNKPGWQGLLCKTKPAGQPADGSSLPITWNKSYTAGLHPDVVVEISGDTVSGETVRTTTTSYDKLGRPTVIEMTTAGGPADPGTTPLRSTISYNNQGVQDSVISSGDAITAEYDSWGRQTEYVDALDNHAVTTYNPAGAVATYNDGAGTYSYSYTPRGSLSSVQAGNGIGLFSYSHTADGKLDKLTYPNGLVADYEHTEAGVPASLSYSQGTERVLTFGTTVDISGRTLGSSSQASLQQFTYDSAGRLTRTEDTRASGCTIRKYGFDSTTADRSNFAEYAPAVDGACQESDPSISNNYTYDSAGRITNNNHAYDTLGRITNIAQADTHDSADGDVRATYYANDRVASLSQTVDDGEGNVATARTAYDLDPSDRTSAVTATQNGVEQSRSRSYFANASDAPSVVASSTDAGATWVSTRYISLPGVGMVASTTAGTTTFHLGDLDGDIVATQPNTPGAATVNEYAESDEYGNAISEAPRFRRYGWRGSSQQNSTDTVGGLILSGQRVYSPAMGSYLQPEGQLPMDGESTTVGLSPPFIVTMPGQMAASANVDASLASARRFPCGARWNRQHGHENPRKSMKKRGVIMKIETRCRKTYRVRANGQLDFCPGHTFCEERHSDVQKKKVGRKIVNWTWPKRSKPVAVPPKEFCAGLWHGQVQVRRRIPGARTRHLDAWNYVNLC